MLRRAVDAFVEQGHVIHVDRVGIGTRLGESGQVEREAIILACDRFLALAQSLRQVTEVDVQIRGPSNTRANRIESILKRLRETIFQTWWQALADEFFLNRYRRLLAPDGEFLRRKVSISCIFTWAGRHASTVGTVKNITTNCSSLNIGCRTSAFANRASPFLRFSRKPPSVAR